MKKRYTVGIDYGTLSGRAVLLDITNGTIVAESVCEYAHGVMDRNLPSGIPLPPQTALQHPADYLEVLRNTVRAVLEQAGVTADDVVGLGIDFTSSTVLPVRADGTPLCFEDAYQNEPNAYVKLWKHNSAQCDADRLNAVARERNEPWLSIYGGKLLGEWAIPKIMQTYREAPDVYRDAARFTEAGDWLVRMLTGRECRSKNYAGLKWMWNAETGYPSDEYFCAVDPGLSGIVGDKFPREVNDMEKTAGTLTAYGAELTGLKVGTPVAVPMVDADAAIPALGITEPGVLLLIVGTSGCQIAHGDRAISIPGINGYVKDGVMPGCYTYEAAQAALGDSFDWFVKNCVPESYAIAARESGKNLHAYLREKAKALRVGESGLVALDWFNGNRSVLQDANLTGMILGLNLRTRPEEIYRALIESTAFGLRVIVENFANGGISIDTVRASGGIALKDEMMMQIYADVLGREIRVIKTSQAAAHGSAIMASVAGGIFQTAAEASKALAATDAIVYTPNAENQAAYDKLYAEYVKLYNYFGRGGNDVMKRLVN